MKGQKSKRFSGATDSQEELKEDSPRIWSTRSVQDKRRRTNAEGDNKGGKRIETPGVRL